ncbi:hypothetical protein GCM10010218_62080 [Streptomyces mashuensis]|uniref:DUF6286 domain-containing protein n=1 Tax=Streptomyces mashuensis TaxID=33904 RepID=A0A919BA94_9ACTN|nr:DUF6286 domain-containing protein [Streptomyces mashuensis]GHF72366.1 hypothetical protein GCM10010218_62080 [Streptomyces mashuensis]
MTTAERAGAPDPAEAVPPDPSLADAPGPARRFWSVRRLPAVLVAAALLAASGLTLYDVVAVRAHRTGMAWRRALAHQLATRHLDDPWVLAGASLALLLGLWLFVLAVTPGLRRLLPLRTDDPDVRAVLDRRAAALVLRDRAMEVPGVRSVRVGVGRRVVRARAQAHFRALDEVRRDVDSVLTDAVRELGLTRAPVLSVRVGRPPKG